MWHLLERVDCACARAYNRQQSAYHQGYIVTDVATVTDVDDPVSDEGEHISEELHTAAEEAEEGAENARSSAENIADITHDEHHRADEQEEHARTRELTAEAFDHLCERVERLEGRFASDVEGTAGEVVEPVAEGEATVTQEPAAEVEEETEVHTRRRRAFARTRRH